MLAFQELLISPDISQNISSIKLIIDSSDDIAAIFGWNYAFKNKKINFLDLLILDQEIPLTIKLEVIAALDNKLTLHSTSKQEFGEFLMQIVKDSLISDTEFETTVIELLKLVTDKVCCGKLIIKDNLTIYDLAYFKKLTNLGQILSEAGCNLSPQAKKLIYEKQFDGIWKLILQGNLEEIKKIKQSSQELNEIKSLSVVPEEEVHQLSPLDFAYFNKHYEIALELIKKGAAFNPDFIYPDTWIPKVDLLKKVSDYINPSDVTVVEKIFLMDGIPKEKFAVKIILDSFIKQYKCSPEMLDLFVGHGAEVDISILHSMIMYGGLELFKHALSQCSQHQLDISDSERDTLLHLAIKGGHLEIAQELIAHGANVNIKNDAGDTLLHLAIKGGHLEIAQELINSKAELDIVNNAKKSVLDLVIENCIFASSVIQNLDLIIFLYKAQVPYSHRHV